MTLGTLVVLSPLLLLPALLDATEDVRLKKSEDAKCRNPHCGVPDAVESKDLVLCTGGLNTSWMALAWGIWVVGEVCLRWEAAFLKFG